MATIATATKTDPFQNALDKARAVYPKVIFTGTHNGFSRYRVQGSEAMSFYTVTEFWHRNNLTGEEGIKCYCECKAGKQDKPCYHRAAVLLSKLAADAPAAFDAALTASIEERRLQAIVGEWWQSIYGDKSAAEVEYEREEAAFWAEYDAAQEAIIAAVMVWIDGYLPAPEITQESLIAALRTLSPDTELATFQGNGQESRNGTAVVAVERAIRMATGREVTAGMAHLTTEDYQMHEMPRWWRQMMTDAAWCKDRVIKVGHLLQSLQTPEPVRCKRCGRACNGETGLCYRCLEDDRRAATRKAQTCTRSSRWDDERIFDPISGWKSAS